MWPGFKSWRRPMWGLVEFFVGSLLCSRVFYFFGYFGFPLSLKKQHFQIPIRLRIKVDVNELNTFKFTHWLVSLHILLTSSLLSSADEFYEKSLSLVVKDWTVFKLFNFYGGAQKHPPPPPPLTPRSESGVKIKKKQSRLTLSSKETKSLEIPSFDKMRTYYS